MRDKRKRRSRRVTVLTLLSVFALLLALLPAGVAGANGDDGVDFWLTVFHNNDGESDLLPSEVVEDEELLGFEGGVAYFAKVLKDARTASNAKPQGDRAKRANIFVSSGDNFLASPAFTASLADGVWYDAIALDALKYDAIALGNHDFDFGPDVLEAFILEGFSRPGHPPYLSANLDFSLEPGLQSLVDDGVIAASTAVKKKGEWIGIVGATTPALPTISSPRDVIVNDLLPVVQDKVDELTAAGVDKIVFISHLQDIDGDILLASQLRDVDVMVAGGGDELLANSDDLLLPTDDPLDIFGPYPMTALDADGNSVPVVTTSGQYGYVGQLVVGFDDDGNVVEVDEDRSGPLRVVSTDFAGGVNPNGSLNTRVVAPVSEFVEQLAANVIGSSEVDLDGRRSPGVRTMETNEGNLIADSQRWQATQLAADFGVPEPDVALQNGGGIRNESIIGAGDITELDTFDMLPFPNFVTVFPAITRDNFKEVLENAVSRTQPGDIPGGTGRFAQVSGFTFEYSESGTAQVIDGDGNITTPGTRVTEVILDDATVLVTGGTVQPGADISLAIVDFNARGGDQYPFDAPFTVLGVSYQQALSNYIQDGLGGLISAADYPEGGEGRITAVP